MQLMLQVVVGASGLGIWGPSLGCVWIWGGPGGYWPHLTTVGKSSPP